MHCCRMHTACQGPHQQSHLSAIIPEHSCAFDRILWCCSYDICSEMTFTVLLCCRLTGLHEHYQDSKIQGCHACWCHLHKFSTALHATWQTWSHLAEFVQRACSHRDDHFVKCQGLPLLWACSSKAEVSELHIPTTRPAGGRAAYSHN